MSHDVILWRMVREGDARVILLHANQTVHIETISKKTQVIGFHWETSDEAVKDVLRATAQLEKYMWYLDVHPVTRRLTVSERNMLDAVCSANGAVKQPPILRALLAKEWNTI